MPKLKREMFLRPTRFTHRFGERDDPLMPVSEQTFDAPYPKLPKVDGTKGFNIKDKGLHVYTKQFSPVDKFKGGHASLSGPRLDNPDKVADAIPQSTKERRTVGPLAEMRKKEMK